MICTAWSCWDLFLSSCVSTKSLTYDVLITAKTSRNLFLKLNRVLCHFSPVAAHLRISEVVVGYPDIFAYSILKTAFFNILLIWHTAFRILGKYEYLYGGRETALQGSHGHGKPENNILQFWFPGLESFRGKYIIFSLVMLLSKVFHQLDIALCECLCRVNLPSGQCDNISLLCLSRILLEIFAH